MQQHETSTIVQGQIIAGKYKLEEQIGKGGWATIYRAEHVELKKTVAVKVLSLHMVHDASAITRFETEARIICKLQHPNIVRVYDFGVLPNNQPYFVMEFLAGQSLSEIIKQNPMPWQQAVPLFMQICEGLTHAHEQNVLHRDIKPDNVLIAGEDNGTAHAYLLDFGLAKVVGADDVGNLTRTGETWGTPHYMSPEQCLGERLDARSDVYSLGCLMYEVLTGQQAFDADNAVLLMEQHLQHTPQPIKQVYPASQCPQLLEDAVMTAMQRRKEERHQSISALHTALSQCLTGEPRTATLRRHVLRLRKSLINRAGAIACLLAIATITVWSVAFGHWQNPHEPKWAKQFAWQAPPSVGGARWQVSEGSIASSIINQDFVQAAKQSGAFAKSASYMQDTVANANELVAAGSALGQLHRSIEAEMALRKAVSIYAKIGADTKLQKLQAENNLAQVLSQQGKFAEADALARSSSEQIGQMLGEQHPSYAQALDGLASVQKDEHKMPSALDTLNRAEEILARTCLPGEPVYTMLRANKSRLLALLHSYSKAKEILTQELVATKSPATKSYLLALLAAIAGQEGNDQRAIELFEGSLQAQAQTQTIYAEFPDVLRQYAIVLRRHNQSAIASHLEEQAELLNKAMATQPQADLFSD